MSEAVKQYLIREAEKIGYRKGTAIIYPQPGGARAVDYVEGDHFEIKDGKLLAYEYPEYQRTCFDKMRFDTLYDPEKGWVEIKK